MLFTEQTSDDVSFENLDSISEMDIASCSDVNDVIIENGEPVANEKKRERNIQAMNEHAKMLSKASKRPINIW